jgi:hypothetical protein
MRECGRAHLTAWPRLVALRRPDAYPSTSPDALAGRPAAAPDAVVWVMDEEG